MSYFLIVTIIIAVLAVLYVWHASKGMRHIPDEDLLHLHTDEDRVLSYWYKQFIKPTLNLDLTEYETGARFINRVHNFKIDHNLLVMGDDIADQYYEITHKILPHFTPSIDALTSDCFFDLRRSVGKNGEIAIIHDHHIRSLLRDNNIYDSSDLNNIIESELDITAHKYLEKILEYRWEKIRQLDDPNLLNKDGTYAYFPVRQYYTPLVGVLDTPKGSRINLLCSDLEFETLIKRWKTFIEKSPFLFRDRSLDQN